MLRCRCCGADERISLRLAFARRFQFGNTCYCNSVLQALFHCAAFRKRIRRYATTASATPASCLTTQLANLFDSMCTSKNRTGVIAPTDFLRRLTRANEVFRAGVQQDAHEFLNFLLNDISERAKVLDNDDSCAPLFASLLLFFFEL